MPHSLVRYTVSQRAVCVKEKSAEMTNDGHTDFPEVFP